MGEDSERFHLHCRLLFLSLPLAKCQCWTLCFSPPIDKIRTTCSSYLLARESQADLLTHAPRCSPPLSCLSLMSGKWKVLPWQLALDSLPEGVRFKRSGLFPFFSHVHFSSMCCRGGTSCSLNKPRLACAVDGVRQDRSTGDTSSPLCRP